MKTKRLNVYVGKTDISIGVLTADGWVWKQDIGVVRRFFRDWMILSEDYEGSSYNPAHRALDDAEAHRLEARWFFDILYEQRRYEQRRLAEKQEQHWAVV